MKNLTVKWLVVGVGIWLLANLVRQYGTLREAWRINTDYTRKIETLQAENDRLLRLIEEATSSSYLEQEVRDKLGLGTENDYWLELPEEEVVATAPGRIFEVKKKKTWQEWWEWLTNK